MSEPVAESTIENYLSMFVLILRILYETLVGTVKALMPIGTMPRKSVRGQVVLITGSGSGIGRLMAVEFGQLGARLVLWDVNEQGNLETKKILEEKGIEAHAYTIDLSRRDEIYRVANEVKSDVGTVDILVNNAGIVNGKNFLDTPDEAIERIMTVNATSMFFTTKAFLGDMVAANQGHVVIIASMAGKIGNAQLVDYSASKFAAVGFAESLSAELYAMGKSGVHITNVCPYFINTGMFDGVQTLSPIALPILEPKYVVENIMEAVLTNKPFMALPKTCYFLMFLASFMPAKTADLMRDLFGVSHTMKNFKGRTNKTE